MYALRGVAGKGFPVGTGSRRSRRGRSVDEECEWRCVTVGGLGDAPRDAGGVRVDFLWCRGVDRGGEEMAGED